MTTEKSKGHLAFIGSREYFSFNGSVLVAPISNPVMPDGYRSARFECFEEYWKVHKRQLEAIHRQFAKN